MSWRTLFFSSIREKRYKYKIHELGKPPKFLNLNWKFSVDSWYTFTSTHKMLETMTDSVAKITFEALIVDYEHNVS